MTTSFLLRLSFRLIFDFSRWRIFSLDIKVSSLSRTISIFVKREFWSLSKFMFSRIESKFNIIGTLDLFFLILDPKFPRIGPTYVLVTTLECGWVILDSRMTDPGFQIGHPGPRILEDDRFEMLMTDSLRKKSPTYWFCRQHIKSVTIIKKPT